MAIIGAPNKASQAVQSFIYPASVLGVCLMFVYSFICHTMFTYNAIVPIINTFLDESTSRSGKTIF